MSPRELFGLVVRTGGLVLCFLGVFDLVHIVLKLFGEDAGASATLSQSAAAAAIYFLLGAGVLLAADRIARALYDDDKPG